MWEFNTPDVNVTSYIYMVDSLRADPSILTYRENKYGWKKLYVNIIGHQTLYIQL